MPSSRSTTPKSVSVIIPTFNRANYIADSIQSVLNQSGGYDIEVIVVDDGSDDNTKEVVERFGEKIRYCKLPASGNPAAPRNTGIRMASYDIIAFQDSDDLWAPNKLSSQMSAFDSPEIALSYGNADVIDSDGREKGRQILQAGQGVGGWIFERLVQDNIVSTSTVITRKQALLEVGLFSESPRLRGVEDYALWLRLCSTRKVIYVDKVLAHYREHDTNISSAGQVDADKRIAAVMHYIIHHVSPMQKKIVRQRLVGLHDVLASLSHNPLYYVSTFYHRVRLRLHY